MSSPNGDDILRVYTILLMFLLLVLGWVDMKIEKIIRQLSLKHLFGC